MFDISQQVGDIRMSGARHDTSDDSDYDTVEPEDKDHHHDIAPDGNGTKKEHASTTVKIIDGDLGISWDLFLFTNT